MATTDAICQYCGKDCGNAGAKTNHEAACPENPANQDAAEQGDSAEIRRAEADPATPAPAQGAQSAGAVAGDLLFTLTNGDDVPPEARANAVSQGIGLLGQVIDRYQRLRHRNQEMKEERAQQARLEPAVEYPACDECGYQFGAEDIGSDDQVRCPDCGALWNIVVDGGGTEANA